MSLSVAVLIPVGPGHERLALRAHASVIDAWLNNRGPFGDVCIACADDADGRGPSWARNQLMNETPADWHFFLDADDEMMPGAFGLVDLTASATFGAICLDGRISRSNRWPVTRETLLGHGANGTLAMGCFVRGDLGLRFDESLRLGEDFDFYMRLPDFTKRREPLVNIGYRKPSAGPPVTRKDRQWQEACAVVVERYRPTSV